MSLEAYKKKRDFRKTKEPKAKRAGHKGHRFVIQKHAASHLHYDFRLELDGVLKSWAVPKGVPFSKGERRLAVQVEDHPVSYIDFEGTIPKGQYGGGTVMVWDHGSYQPLTSTPAKDLAAGKLHVFLKGQKLQGEWFLIRLQDGKNWLLGKAKESLKPISKSKDDRSALSGRSMAAIGKSDSVWEAKKARSLTKTKQQKRQEQRGSKRSECLLPSFVEPMKAKLVSDPLPGEWLYEVKFDGFRALAFKRGNQCRLLSRNNKDFGVRFPDIFRGLLDWDLDDAIVDGEIVALDSKGKSSFQLLQAYDLGQERPALYFYVFDLLRWKGKDLRSEPLEGRRRLLERALENAPPEVRFSSSLEGQVGAILKEAESLKLEGLIGKQAGSLYESGKRSGAWIKLKLQNEQEMVVGGYTDPEGSRSQFGSLLIGYYRERELVCAGKVGTGFEESLLRSLGRRLRSLSQRECPFSNLPEKRTGRYGAGITTAVMKRCHWVKPILVCQVKFSEWTRDGKLRQPVFLGLRGDKSAKEVTRETAT